MEHTLDNPEAYNVPWFLDIKSENVDTEFIVSIFNFPCLLFSSSAL